jgi:hypothetical protein
MSRCSFQQGDTSGFGLVMFELLQVEKVSSIVTATKDDVTACRIGTEGSKHF